MKNELEPEPTSPKDLLRERILKVLEINDALCMDVQEERDLLAGRLVDLLIDDKDHEEITSPSVS